MQEPNWDELTARLIALTMKQLRPIGSRWFNGCLGGASTKAEYVSEMVTQMRCWWFLDDDERREQTREEVMGVLKDIELQEVS